MQALNSYIDHTLLRPDATTAEIQVLCNEALTNNFAAVCVLPSHVRDGVKFLKGSSVKVCSVVGFPLGANTLETKCFEASQLASFGAQELDMVINIGALKSGNYQFIKDEIIAVVRSAAPAIVKVIIETCLLTKEEKITVCQLACEAGAHFVKTSTGFSKSGATVEDISLMSHAVAGYSVGVKASGGIKDRTTALAMINAGATRIGTSSGVSIISRES